MAYRVPPHKKVDAPLIQELTREAQLQRERAQRWRRAAKESRLKLRELQKRRSKLPSESKRHPPEPGRAIYHQVERLRIQLAEHKARRKALRVERDRWQARCHDLEAAADLRKRPEKEKRVSQFGAALVGASIPLLFSQAWVLFVCVGVLGLALVALDA